MSKKQSPEDFVVRAKTWQPRFAPISTGGMRLCWRRLRGRATAITGEGEIAIINAILEVLTRDPELFVYEKAFLAYKVSRGLNN